MDFRRERREAKGKHGGKIYNPSRTVHRSGPRGFAFFSRRWLVVVSQLMNGLLWRPSASLSVVTHISECPTGQFQKDVKKAIPVLREFLFGGCSLSRRSNHAGAKERERDLNASWRAIRAFMPIRSLVEELRPRA